MRASEVIGVVVADPRAMLRRAIALLVGREPGLAMVGEADTLADAVRAVTSGLPDLVVIDGDLLGRRGAETVAAMRAAHPGVRVLVLSDDGPGAARQAERAGADAVLPKRASSEQLVGAIRRVAVGPPAQGIGRAGDAGSAVCAVARLDPDDREMLRLVALGYSVGQIARRVGRGPGEVRLRRDVLAAELGAGSRAGLVRLAEDAGLIGPGV